MRTLIGCVALAAVVAEGCGHSCNEMGCQPGIMLELASPMDEPGEYRFEAITSGEVVTCAATIPLDRSGNAPPCDDRLYVGREEITTRNGDAVSGSAGDRIVSIWVAGEHSDVSISATRDGEEVLEAEVMPRYEGVEINGEGCGECPAARHTIEN